MRTICVRVGEKATVRYTWIMALNFSEVSFFIGEEEVKVPHNTEFKAAKDGQKLRFSHVRLAIPGAYASVPAMFFGHTRALIYYGLQEGGDFDKNEVTAVRVPGP